MIRIPRIRVGIPESLESLSLIDKFCGQDIAVFNKLFFKIFFFEDDLERISLTEICIKVYIPAKDIVGEREGKKIFFTLLFNGKD